MKTTLRTLFLLLALLANGGLLSARAQVTISGRVVDARGGQPLPGVNILVQGTTRGTVTDVAGMYDLTANSGADTLVFSFIGFEPQTVPVNGRSTINVTMRETVYSGEDLVVVGYTTQQRRDITGAVSTVDPDELLTLPPTTISGTLVSRLPGVKVRTSGQPGQPPAIEIRGLGNFGSNRPLFVVDGLLTDDTRDFNPDDIASIQVLKDASAAAIYGSRAANGVVVITTKKGRPGPIKVDFSSQVGAQNIQNTYDLMGVDEWSRIMQQAYANGGVIAPEYVKNPPAGINTDWQDAVMQTGTLQDYNLALSGGQNNLSYYVSGNYFTNKGATIGPDFKRYSARVNGGLDRGRLNVQESLLLSYTDGQNQSGSPFTQVIRMLPVIPVEDPNNPGGFGYGSPSAPTLGTNPVAEETLNDSNNESARLMGSISGAFDLTKYLSYKLSLGLEYNTNILRNFRQDGFWYWSQPYEPAGLFEDRNRYRSTLVENTLNFQNEMGQHDVNALVGYTVQQTNFSFSSGAAKGYISTSGGGYFPVLGAGTSSPTVNGRMVESALISYLARLEYGYADKYLFTFSFRRDGSSRFSPDNQYGNFPSFSAGRRLTTFSTPPMLTQRVLRTVEH